MRYCYVAALFLASFTVGCRSGIPKDALALSAQSLERRQISSRRFSTAEEKKILISSASLLQDLGFTIDDSESELGFVVGSKDRSAVEGGQVAGKIAMALFTGANVPIDKNQRLRASIVTRPVAEGIVVRATFQRIVWNENGQVSKLEMLDDPKMYQDFFEKLSKAVFLEAQSI